MRLAKNEPSGVKVTEEEILKKYSTDYRLIPTTVFSPTEYSFIGMSEEEAAKALGKDNIEVYHRETTPLQYSLYKKNTKIAYMKVIVDIASDKVLGMHYFGPTSIYKYYKNYNYPLPNSYHYRKMDIVLVFFVISTY